MAALRSIGAAVLVVLVSVTFAVAAPGPKIPRPLKVKVYGEGESFCPWVGLVFGGIVIQSGRCYRLLVFHDTRGVFLAFAAPEAKIPPGQLVRLNTPAGAKVKGRIFYLIPIRAAGVVMPVGTVSLVGFRVEDLGSRLTITLISAPAPNLIVVFTVRA